MKTKNAQLMDLSDRARGLAHAVAMQVDTYRFSREMERVTRWRLEQLHATLENIAVALEDLA